MIIGISGKIGSGKDLIAKIIQYLYLVHIKDTLRGNLDVLNEEFNPIIDYNTLFGTSWEVKKFARKLKEIVALLIGCTLEQLEDQNFKSTNLSKEWSTWKVRNEFTKITIPNKLFLSEEDARAFCDECNNSQHQYTYWEEPTTPRKLLQLIGTEIGRNIIHPNCWLNSTFSDYLPNNLANWQIGSEREFPNWIITDMRFINEIEGIHARKGISIRVNRHLRINEHKLYTLAQNNLDLNDPDMDKAHTIAGRLGLGFDESTNEWIDIEDCYRGKEHESETALDNYKNFDYIIDNNGSIEELVEKVKVILIKEGII